MTGDGCAGVEHVRAAILLLSLALSPEDARHVVFAVTRGPDAARGVLRASGRDFSPMVLEVLAGLSSLADGAVSTTLAEVSGDVRTYTTDEAADRLGWKQSSYVRRLLRHGEQHWAIRGWKDDESGGWLVDADYLDRALLERAEREAS